MTECTPEEVAADVVEVKPIKTNADKIRAMTDEELAAAIIKAQYEEGDVCPPNHAHNNPLCLHIDGCRKCWLDWLKQEVESDG